jgi:hypothetical protein
MTSAHPAALAADRANLGSTSFLARLVHPNLTDVLFVGILMWTVVLTASGWGRLLWDGDTALHTRIGNFILTNGYIPSTDPFSFTRNGQHWLATEWATGILFAFLNATFGLKAVVFLCGVTIAATLTLLLRSCLRAGANSLIALVAVLMTMNASSFHYHARPHVFTWLFLGISMRLLAQVGTVRDRSWLLIPLTALWANVHGGYAVLFPVLGILLIGSIGRSVFKNYAILTALCGLASLVNPFGYKLHLETLHYLRNQSVVNTIQEFQPPDFRSEPQLYFMAILFAGLGVCGFLIAKRCYSDALFIAAFGYLALTSVRHIPIFLIVAVPILTRELSIHWARYASFQKKSSIAGILNDISLTLREKMPAVGIWSAAALLALWFVPPASSWPRDFSDDRFPVQIASRHSAELAQSRLFTTDQWADYLMFKNPAQRVFMDDRGFYDQAILADALKIMGAEQGWRDALAKYRIDAVLSPMGTPLASQLVREPHWKLADKDAGHLLFFREAY